MVIPKEAEMRKCTKCGETKPLDEYLPYKIRSNGRLSRQFRCRSCYNIYNREWRAKQGDKYRDMQRNRWHERLNTMSPEERVAFNNRMSKKTRDRTRSMKEQVYNAYGGYVCKCCGETEPMFLTIDHINNDGAKHRRDFKGNNATPSIYRWLIKNKFPEGFQVLCWNCQWGKVKNNGVCPHNGTSNDYPVMGVGSSDPKRSAPKITKEALDLLSGLSSIRSSVMRTYL